MDKTNLSADTIPATDEVRREEGASMGEAYYLSTVRQLLAHKHMRAHTHINVFVPSCDRARPSFCSPISSTFSAAWPFAR